MESSSLDTQQIKAVEKNRAWVCSIDLWKVLEENLIPWSDSQRETGGDREREREREREKGWGGSSNLLY
jgi:hypothetical protein